MTFFLSALFRSLTSDLDDISMSVEGGAKLQVVFGDITNETTDAVVNTTDFVDFHNGRSQLQWERMLESKWRL